MSNCLKVSSKYLVTTQLTIDQPNNYTSHFILFASRTLQTTKKKNHFHRRSISESKILQRTTMSETSGGRSMAQSTAPKMKVRALSSSRKEPEFSLRHEQRNTVVLPKKVKVLLEHIFLEQIDTSLHCGEIWKDHLRTIRNFKNKWPYKVRSI